METCNGSLDYIVINRRNNPEDRDRPLTRQEMFVLAWLVCVNEGRVYDDMMKDCGLTLAECRKAVRGLFELDLLRFV